MPDVIFRRAREREEIALFDEEIAIRAALDFFLDREVFVCIYFVAQGLRVEGT